MILFIGLPHCSSHSPLISMKPQSRAPEGGGVAAPAQGVGEHHWVSERLASS